MEVQPGEHGVLPAGFKGFELRRALPVWRVEFTAQGAQGYGGLEAKPVFRGPGAAIGALGLLDAAGEVVIDGGGEAADHGEEIRRQRRVSLGRYGGQVR